MPSFKKIFRPHAETNPLLPFLREAKKRLKWQLWFWSTAFLVLLVLTVIFGALHDEAEWMLILFIIFLILMFYSFLFTIWKISLYRWSKALTKIFSTRYRTSFGEDERLLISFNWILRTFLSIKIVDGAIKENYDFLEIIHKKILIDYQRINTPKVDVWIWRMLSFIGRLVITILLTIPMAVTWLDYRIGLCKPRATKSIKTSFKQMHREFLSNLDERTIW